VSTGGEDKCIFQWAFGEGDFDDDDDIEAGDQSCPPFDDDVPMDSDSKADKIAEKPAKKEGDGGDFDLDDGLEEGDEAGCINIVQIAEQWKPSNF
jgi:hypothetical protein